MYYGLIIIKSDFGLAKLDLFGVWKHFIDEIILDRIKWHSL